MSIPVLPEIIPPGTDYIIKTMKASQYGGLLKFCAWKDVLIHSLGSNKNGTLPPHAGSLSGTVAHNLLEMVLKNRLHSVEELESAWDLELAAKARKVADDYPWLPPQSPLVDFEKKFRTRFMAEKVWEKKAKNANPSNRAPEGEEKYVIEGLTGRIDLVVSREDYVNIVDYKTGMITGDDGHVKPEFVIQLKLYALLFQKQTGRKVDKLTIVNLAGQRFEIPFEQKELDPLHEQIKEKLHTLNHQLKNVDLQGLANLSEETCRFCQFRPVCTYYWSPGSTNPGDFEAVFREVKTAGDGSLFICLEKNGENYFIKGLTGRSPEDFAGKQGRLLRILNTWPSNQPGLDRYYHATSYSALFWVLN